MIYRTAGCFLTYGAALVIIFIAKKIPIVKKLIPYKKEWHNAPFNLSLKPNTYHTSHTDHLM